VSAASPRFASLALPAEATLQAPDGSDARVLLSLPRGSMAHFTLAPGNVSKAVAHRTVEEIWYVLGGAGEMWRSQAGREEITRLVPGMCLTIPCGTAFQFRAAPETTLTVVAITMPPWPGADEAFIVNGRWPATL
jgi:mannose-6-phosphate isomerase-like protein (cupin superfamily)